MSEVAQALSNEGAIAAVAAWIQAMAAAAAAFIAGWAAIYVRRQWLVQREQIESAREAQVRLQSEQARPFVVADLVPGDVPGSIHLVIENVGKTLARNVRVKFDPPLISAWDKADAATLADSIMIREGIPALPPGRRVETLFDFAPERLRQHMPTAFRVTLGAEDYLGRPQPPLEYVLDLAYQYELVRMSRKGLHEIAESVRKIEGALKGWGEAGGGLRVWARDGDARDGRTHGPR